MKTSLHRILTKDSIELVGLLYEPETTTHKIVVHVHGMAGNFYENKFLDFIAKTLTSHDIAFFAFNNRGCELVKDLIRMKGNRGEIVRIGNSFEKFEESLLDIDAALAFVESKGFTEIHLAGHSLGAPKIAYYASEKKDPRLASLLFLSPADMVGLAKADEEYKRDIETAEKMIAEGKGGEVMPFMVWNENHLSADTYVSIASEASPVAIFNFHNPSDPLATLSKISIPAITIMGSKDGALTISVETTMERIQKAMTRSPKVKTHILGDADHGYNGYEQELAEVIKAWVLEM